MKAKRLQLGWKEVELRELFDLKYGFSLPGSKRISGDVEVYGSNGVVGAHNKGITKGQTIIVGRKGSIGKINLSKKACFPIDTTYYIDETKINCNIKWLFYTLKKLGLEKLNRAAAVPGLNRNDVYGIKIPLPPLQTQERIVEILEKAEQLKEKRKQTIKLLDDYLKSVFNEMFLSKKDNFGVKKGNELFELAYGRGLPDKDRDGENHSVYGSNGVIGSHSDFLVEGPGIIIGRKGSIGEVHYCANNFWPIDTTYYIKPLQKINWIYLYFLLKCTNLKLNKSTAIPGLNRNDVYDLNLIDPPLDLQLKFSLIFDKVEKLKEKQGQSLKEIEKLLNVLIKKAFRGGLVR